MLCCVYLTLWDGWGYDDNSNVPFPVAVSPNGLPWTAYISFWDSSLRSSSIGLCGIAFPISLDKNLDTRPQKLAHVTVWILDLSHAKPGDRHKVGLWSCWWLPALWNVYHIITWCLLDDDVLQLTLTITLSALVAFIRGEAEFSQCRVERCYIISTSALPDFCY